MNSFLKKAFLIYILFLFTTLSGSPSQATDSSAMVSDLAFQQMKEQLIKEHRMKEQSIKESRMDETGRTIKAFEEGLLTKDLTVKKAIPAEEPIIEEKPQGIIPALIEIPAIDAKAKVIQVGQTADGSMEAPEDIHTIGWYELGTKPGNNGNAVVAGHVDGDIGPGTFYNLKKLKPGDTIHITGIEGTELTFVVIVKQSYPPEDAPLKEIFGSAPKPKLNLITCTGNFNAKTGNYEERLVVYTELVER